MNKKINENCYEENVLEQILPFLCFLFSEVKYWLFVKNGRKTFMNN